MEGSQHPYERYLELCPSCTLGLGTNSDLDPNCRTCPPWNMATLARMADGFTPEELVRAGIAITTADGTVPNPALFGIGNHVVAQRRMPNEPPYALLTRAGVLPATCLADSILYDYDLRVIVTPENPYLFIACSMADLLVLRSARFPVTLAGRLGEATEQQLQDIVDKEFVFYPEAEDEHETADEDKGEDKVEDEGEDEAEDEVPAENVKHDAANAGDLAGLAERPERETSEDAVSQAGAASGTAPPTDDPHKQVYPPVFVLVGFSPARMSLAEPPQLQTVVHRLLQCQRFLGIDVSPFAVWSPSAGELEEISFCRVAGSPDAVTRALRKSLEQSLFRLDHRADPLATVEAPIDFCSALERLESLMGDPDCTSDAWAAALAAHARAVKRELSGPLLAQAMARADLDLRNVGVVQARLAQELHLQLPFAFRPEVMTPADMQPTKPATKPDNSTRVFKLLKEFLALTRDLNR